MWGVFLAVALLTSVSAHAIPVIWTLNDVQFDDGGTASGSYTYDASTDTYSSVAVTTTGTGGVFPSAVYLDACNVSTCHPDVIDSRPTFEKLFGPGDIESLLSLALDTPMTNAGGVISITVGEAAEVDFVLRTRHVVSGSVSAVPVPAAVWLFASALMRLFFRQHKKPRLHGCRRGAGCCGVA